MSLNNYLQLEKQFKPHWNKRFKFKVAQNSFQHFPTRRFWWFIIATLYQLMLQLPNGDLKDFWDLKNRLGLSAYNIQQLLKQGFTLNKEKFTWKTRSFRDISSTFV